MTARAGGEGLTESVLPHATTGGPGNDAHEAASDNLVLVDTSVWIFALSRRGQQAIRRRVDALLQQDTAATCGLVELELLGGAGRADEFDRLARRLGGVRRIEILEGDWRAGAGISSLLRRAGRTVPPTDAFLAAVAMRTGAILLHADADFDVIAQHVPEVRVESLVNLVGTA
jgi:predicted nucleic acid-binding protein